MLPLGTLYTPLRPVAELPVVPYDTVRCKGCAAVLNPYARVDFVGKARALQANPPFSPDALALGRARLDLDLSVLLHAQPLPSALRGHQRERAAGGALSIVHDA